jgi:hypothetical protein
MTIHETPTKKEGEYLRGGPSHPHCDTSRLYHLSTTQIGDSKEFIGFFLDSKEFFGFFLDSKECPRKVNMT